MLVSDGATAKKIVKENIDIAICFLYENRCRTFTDENELGDFILELAEIVNEGIVKSGSLFRNGADSQKYNYTKICDIPVIWEWFKKTFYWLLCSDTYEPYEVAAFSEIIINGKGHFFSDGCGKISMLTALYVFMRNNLPGVQCLSRNEYFEILEGVQNGIPADLENLKHIFADDGFLNFLNYYGSLCRTEALNFYYNSESDDSYTIRLNGRITEENVGQLKKYMEAFYNEKGNVQVVFDCRKLVYISSIGARFFAGLKSSGKRFTFIKLGYECEVSLFIEKLWEHIENRREIPEIKVIDSMIIEEGFNGKIYRINNELIAKTFKKEFYYDDMQRERHILRNALIYGIAAPFSFGYSVINGQIALLMELLNSGTYMDLLTSEDEQEYQKHLKKYVALVKDLHKDYSEEISKVFPVKAFEKSVVNKADIVDELIHKEYRGKARKIIENIDEPLVLIHGDIQPKNVMFREDEMILIDFDTFCIDKEIYDYAALYFFLFEEYDIGEKSDCNVNKLTYDASKRFWEGFIELIYKDKSRKEKEDKLKFIKLISAVRTVYIEKKRNSEDSRLEKSIRLLEERIDAV